MERSREEINTLYNPVGSVVKGKMGCGDGFQIRACATAATIPFPPDVANSDRLPTALRTTRLSIRLAKVP
jgi:hypothetical protein